MCSEMKECKMQRYRGDPEGLLLLLSAVLFMQVREKHSDLSGQAEEENQLCQ